MFEKAGRTDDQFFLRLYSWKSGAITIGRNQKEQLAVDAGKLNGTPVIRRVTGGRALYHDPSELTYSIAGNCAGKYESAFGNSVYQSNRAISAALLEFLNALKVKAHYVRQSSSNFLSTDTFHTLPCFESKARHEIIGDRGKLAASAQRRVGEIFLQHGSIKINGLAGHPALTASVTNSLDSSNIEPLENSRFDKFAPVFYKSLGRSLGIEFVPAILDEVDLMEISAFEKSVKKNSLGLRDLIKQNRMAVSLSGESHN